MKTKVIFRKFPKGDVIALFPAIAGDMNPAHCLSYQTVGQHGAASLDIVACTTLAKRQEYRPLLRELRRKGYDLEIAKRATRGDYAKRREQIKR